jgi:hypothetical protein
MIDPDELQKQMTEKLQTLMADLERFRKEINDPEHLVELCFLEGELRDVQGAMSRPPVDAETPKDSNRD